MDQPDLRSAEHYINRELSLLEFNERVLAQALDEKVPLLERLKFLCISSNNLDEFFEIRVAGLKQRIELGSDQPGPDGLTITEQLQAIHDRTRASSTRSTRCLNDVLLPALRHQGIELLARATWDAETARWLEQYFEREVEPVLSPLGLDPARPFPRIQNKSLNFIVRLAGQGRLRTRHRSRHRAGAALAAARGRTAGGRWPQAIRAVDRHRAAVRVEALLRHGRARLLPVPGHAQQRSVRRRRRSRRPAARTRRRTRASPLRRRGATRGLARLPAGSRRVPDAAVHAERGGFLRGVGTGEPESPRGDLRPGAAARSQVPDLHARRCRVASPAPPTCSP